MNRGYRTEICNVLVIGSGGAGLRAAIGAHEKGCEVMVIGKRVRNDAHTTLAAGGINAALGNVDPKDDWVQHFVDTYQDGYFIADPEIVETLVKESPDRVNELVDWGASFAVNDEGKLDQSQKVGINKEESDVLLHKIFKHQERLDLTCRFRWTENAVAIWDNRSVNHYAISDFFPGRGLGYERIMDRIAIQGDQPN